ncbi:MAG: amino acid ABC transporter permease [Clostridia bacterium]|nr:amino acid ABC transporter permease [Clostridia bacterium]
MSLFFNVTLQLLEGLLYTLLIFGVTLLVALPLGLLIAFGSKSKFKIISAITRAFVWVIRGTPLMLQIIFFLFLPTSISNVAQKIGIPLDVALRGEVALLIMVCVAFSINYACYFSEIYRGGIQSIPAGQYEAAQVLGMTKSQTFSKVIFLQVVKRIVAPMSNEIITLVKDTALASVVIRLDLFTVAKGIVNTKAILWPIFYAGLFYLLINGLLTILLGKLEKKLGYFKV